MARAHGFNVGVNAHIDPKPHEITLYVEWNRVKFHFPIQSGADVNPPGGAMWASPPTFLSDRVPFNQALMLSGIAGGW